MLKESNTDKEQQSLTSDMAEIELLVQSLLSSIGALASTLAPVIAPRPDSLVAKAPDKVTSIRSTLRENARCILDGIQEARAAVDELRTTVEI